MRVRRVSNPTDQLKKTTAGMVFTGLGGGRVG